MIFSALSAAFSILAATSLLVITSSLTAVATDSDCCFCFSALLMLFCAACSELQELSVSTVMTPERSLMLACNLLMNASKEWESCASSSLPLAFIRTVKSPSPLAIDSIIWLMALIRVKTLLPISANNADNRITMAKPNRCRVFLVSELAWLIAVLISSWTPLIACSA
ncbi:hypothetical protein VFDL14_04780 [Vibrio fortis]|uniref:Secreted protein n=1 Tax=Vibrio fortis TaxID=212667 RepID=A0A066UVS7_9VIBR|nr:hypothetical protein VFDL14_04780 [Vibrio fortis]